VIHGIIRCPRIEVFLDVSSQELAESYNEKYRQSNYFRYRGWLYRPFVKALVGRVGLRPGERLLDAGCGQGFFTWLFAECGINAVGVDISAAGVSAASRWYRSPRVTFEVGDILELRWGNEFDCVFSRSCSLYNSENFETEYEVTDTLLSYVRPGGILIFDYYSRLGGREKTKDWIYHSLDSVRKHFSRYPGAQVYFSPRIETMILGRFAFSQQVADACAWLSLRTGMGGELIAFVPKTVP
jgi:SAM-dependent methyltransferase